MKIARKIDMVNRAVAMVRASIPPDPLAHLSARQRAAADEYRRTVEPSRQWSELMDGIGPAVALTEMAGLPADCSEQQAQEIYQKELKITALRYNVKGSKK